MNGFFPLRGRSLGAALFWACASCTFACNGTPAAPLPSPDAASATCPATLEATINASCTVPGLRCGPPYKCGFIEANLLCVCTRGSFLCTDSMGNEVDTPPKCPGPVTTQTCPSTETAATFAACTEQGRQCFYPSSCPSRYDACQCTPGALLDGGFGLRFDCDRGTCTTDAGPVVFDSGVADAGPDARGTLGEAGADSTSPDAVAPEGGAPDATPPDAAPPSDAGGSDVAFE